MKIVVLFGSPKKDGNTKKLLDKYLKTIDADKNNIDIIYACDLNILGCQDCEVCKEKVFCHLDDWQKVYDVYKKIQMSDTVIVASPIFFFSFPSQLKALFDRFQPFYYKRFLRKEPREKIKDGVVLLTGGGTEKDFTRFVLEKQIKMVFDVLDVVQKEFIIELNTDSRK